MRWQGSDWTDAIHTLICIYRCNVGLVGAFLHRRQLLLLMSLRDSPSLLSKLVQITLSQVQIGPNVEGFGILGSTRYELESDAFSTLSLSGTGYDLGPRALGVLVTIASLMPVG